MSVDLWSASRGNLDLAPVWVHAGAPSNGTSGTLAGIAAPGDLLVDTTNKVLYINTNTQASPTWSSSAVGTSGAVAITGGTINGTPIGGTTPAAGTFTTLTTSGAVITGGTIQGVTQLDLAAGAFFNDSVSMGLTAVGTTRTNALQLTNALNQVTAGASTTGVTLVASATVGVGGKVRVFNDTGANSFHVYAAGSDTIDGTAGSTGVVLTNGFYCDYLLGAAGAFTSFRTAFTRST